jgi:hypothetical protein
MGARSLQTLQEPTLGLLFEVAAFQSSTEGRRKGKRAHQRCSPCSCSACAASVSSRGQYSSSPRMAWPNEAMCCRSWWVRPVCGERVTSVTCSHTHTHTFLYALLEAERPELDGRLATLPSPKPWLSAEVRILLGVLLELDFFTQPHRTRECALPRVQTRAVGKLFVVPAGDLPVPVSERLYRA